MSLASGSVRITGSTGRRQRIFAVTQIAASFVLLAGASMLITTLIALQTTQTGVDTRQVLAINVPAMSYGKTPQQVLDFYKESIRRVDALPGVTRTAFAMIAPWRDAEGGFGVGLQFSADGHAHGKDDPRAQWRIISPGFFTALGVPIVAGRDFNALDGQNQEPVVIVSADSRTAHVSWSGSDQSACLLDRSRARVPSRPDSQKSRFRSPHRIIGVTADVDDEHIVPAPTSTIYSTFADSPLFRRSPLHPHHRKSLFAGNAGNEHHSARCPPINPLSTPPLSKTSAQKCLRQTA